MYDVEAGRAGAEDGAEAVSAEREGEDGVYGAKGGEEGCEAIRKGMMELMARRERRCGMEDVGVWV